MDEGGGSRSGGRKSVRFPEHAAELSREREVYVESDEESEATGSSETHISEEVDYFSFTPGTRSRSGTVGGQSRNAFAAPANEDDDNSDSNLLDDHHGTESEDSDKDDTPGYQDTRAATLANTIANRRPRGGTLEGPPALQTDDQAPALHVTPPPEAPPNAALSSVHAGVESMIDLGRSTGGLAPGAVQVDPGSDRLDEEYRRRREELLGSLPSRTRLDRLGASSVPVSLSGSPLLRSEDPDGSINDVPLLDLTDRRHERQGSGGGSMHGVVGTAGMTDLRQRLQQVQRDPHRGLRTPDDASPLMTPVSEKNADLGAEPRKSDDQETREAAEEARGIAKELVQAHAKMGAMKGKGPDQLYVPNTNFLNNAGMLDEDMADNANAEEEKEGDNMPESGVEAHEDYVPPPKRVREGVLGALLRLYADQDDNKSQTTLVSGASSPIHSESPSSPGSPGASPLLRPTRPNYFRAHSSEDVLGRRGNDASSKRPKWYKHKSTTSVTSLGRLAASSMSALAAPHASPHLGDGSQHDRDKERKPFYNKIKQDQAKAAAKAEAKKRKKLRLAEQARITVHIADVLQRQRFILRIGRALMLFGAPSHRLEEYLVMTARVLEIDAQFLYMPGCMLVAFGDVTTHTSETKLLRTPQGLNLAKLDATHLIYKEVVHDIMSLEEASEHIDRLLSSKTLYSPWLTIMFFGLASASICIFGFGGSWPDIPITFFLGGIVGFLQVWVAPKSDLYSNVFEVTSSILVSFAGRAFGSISRHNTRVFCFSAIVQGSLALILPGYIILCGSLELQSKNLVAGAVRMFYAIIYSMFLSFGITMGSLIYGYIDGGATSEITCSRSLNPLWRILFVPLSAMFLGMVNQANLRQLPTMIVIAGAGYTVLYFVQKQVQSASAFTSAIGAFVIGILGNLYSRVGHGLAFAAMLPGIFVIVPSGVASQGSLVSGIILANEIVGNTTKNDTSSSSSTTSSSSSSSSSAIDLTGTSLGGTMSQVAVGITVGLFVATLVVYPLGLGKKRSGLFTF